MDVDRGKIVAKWVLSTRLVVHWDPPLDGLINWCPDSFGFVPLTAGTNGREVVNDLPADGYLAWPAAGYSTVRLF